MFTRIKRPAHEVGVADMPGRHRDPSGLRSASSASTSVVASAKPAFAPWMTPLIPPDVAMLENCAPAALKAGIRIREA